MAALQATGDVNNTDHGYTYLRWQLIILGELEYVRMLDECHVDSALGYFRFSEALAWSTIFPYVFS